MRALVVGAGAVGQVYGRHLQAGGAEVSFLVKPAHARATRAGLTLYGLNRRPSLRTQPETVGGFEVLTEVAEVAGRRWDQVYLTMSSTALRAGSWFAQLAGAIHSATLVVLQPGPDDRAFVLQHLPAAQVVQGIIRVISYLAPLPGETRFPRPGVAYWIPPLASSPMSGARDRLGPVLAALKNGGLPARRHRDVQGSTAFPEALAMPLLAVLEEAGWSFQQLRRGDRLGRAWRGGREAMRVTARREGRRVPAALWLLGSPWGVRALLRAAPLAVPFAFQAYLQAHFSKVGDQTRDFLRHYITRGHTAGLPVGTLRRIASDIDVAIDPSSAPAADSSEFVPAVSGNGPRR